MAKFGRKTKQLLKIVGPGLITGAADDDPSGIATYSQTGAQFGYGQLWTALFLLPFMVAIQEACARIGAVTGKGIAAVVKENYNRKILYGLLGAHPRREHDQHRRGSWRDGRGGAAHHSGQLHPAHAFLHGTHFIAGDIRFL